MYHSLDSLSLETTLIFVVLFCRWAEALKLATRAEVPSPNDVSCVEESTSLSSSSMSSKNES